MKGTKKLLKNFKSHQVLILVAIVVGGYFLYTYSKSKGGSLDSYSDINTAGKDLDDFCSFEFPSNVLSINIYLVFSVCYY